MPIPVPTAVRFEHLPSPLLGTGSPTPRISWRFEQAPEGFAQHRYEIEVRRGAALAAAPSAGGVSTVVVESAEQVLVPWPAAPLTSREAAEVRVRVADAAGEWSPWSAPARVEAGLLERADWAASFVTPASIAPPGAPSPILATAFRAPDDVVAARLYVTAQGLYAAHLNGERIGDVQLAPGWTAYATRLRYQTYDVTGQIASGTNVLAVRLGNGWFRGRLGFAGGRALYGQDLALLAQLEITTADGRVTTVATDESWVAWAGEITADDLYDGQTTDLRLARRLDVLPAPGEAEAEAVKVLPDPSCALVAPAGPPVRITQELPAAEILTTPSGARVVDFGQNLVGWVRLRVRGLAPGATVTLRHAEVLEDGELGTRPLRTAKATDTYTLAGPEQTLLEPTFTFHGFRYAQIEGVADLEPGDVTACVIHSDMQRTGWFDSSDPLLNRLHENVVWGMRGNFLDVPTDCPQRDERLGWTGDIQVFSPTASFVYDCAGFLDSWLADLAADQAADGTVPIVVPDVLTGVFPPMPSAAWGDAGVIVPAVLLERFADVGLVRRQFDSMRAWVDREAAAAPDGLWVGGFQFGDWLDPDAPPENPAAAKAYPDIVASACFQRSAALLAAMARVLGEDEAAAHYGELAAKAKAAIGAEYVTPSGRVLSDSPTAYAMALAWGLLEEGQRKHAGDRLADLVRCSGFRISTGFVGTPIVLDALTVTGHADVAYRLMTQTACPSWLYAVTMGATTIWERWDSMLPDGSINPGEMTSFNHYALGAVADWLHRTVAGLAPAAPGYREITVRPIPGGGLTCASARHTSPYGDVAVAWRIADGVFHLDLTVPVGASAQVWLPGAEVAETVGHGSHTWEVPYVPAVPVLGARATCRDLLDHPEAWGALAEQAVALGLVPDDRAAAANLAIALDAPAALAPVAVVGPIPMPIAPEAAERLNAALAPYLAG